MLTIDCGSLHMKITMIILYLHTSSVFPKLSSTCIICTTRKNKLFKKDIHNLLEP